MNPKIILKLPKDAVLKQTPAGPIYVTKKYLYAPSYSFNYGFKVYYRYKRIYL